MTHAKPLTVEWTTWNQSERTEVVSWLEAQALLAKLGSHTDPPCIVEFYNADSGQSLGLGIGRDTTVVTYQDSLDPPYFISLGDKLRAGIEWFCYGNEETEYLAKNLIPLCQGTEALKYFIENRTQPDSITWERL